MISPVEVLKAQARLAPYLVKTPLLEYAKLNERFGCRVFIKYEGAQYTGSFKLRGALNTILGWREQGEKVSHIVATSSGNHAQGVAYAARLFNYPCTIFMPENISPLKLQKTKDLGAQVVLCPTRQETFILAQGAVSKGAHYIPPFDLDSVIAGQGTSCLEALQDGICPNKIFATVSGGGWVSGTWLATQALGVTAGVIAAEPTLANDAYLSFKSGKIVELPTPPLTIADGARVQRVADRTFEILKKLDAIICVEERDIVDWMNILSEMSGLKVEPTSAVALAGAWQWVQASKHSIESGDFEKICLNSQKDATEILTPLSNSDGILVMISGGNVST